MIMNNRAQEYKSCHSHTRAISDDNYTAFVLINHSNYTHFSTHDPSKLPTPAGHI